MKLVGATCVFFSALVCLAVVSQAERIDPKDVIYVDTDKGRIVIQCLNQFAPNHIKRVKQLARAGFYDGQIWHRVIDKFVAQTGDPLGKGYGGTGVLLKAEFGSRSHNTGTVNMARVAGNDDSADSQFSIMYVHNKFLDGEYTVWGQVLGGFDVVKALNKGEPPESPSKLLKMRVPGDADPDCKDLHDLCVWWAMPGELGISSLGECTNNPSFMRKNCPLSCGLCAVPEEPVVPCDNLYKKCETWAESGECDKNPGWMLKNCRQACDDTC
eukprot:m.164727 g.164727  ORF g.164727 m.164727 type:complete len:270 (+) comp14409_c0_seq2:407-1216(+)